MTLLNGCYSVGMQEETAALPCVDKLALNSKTDADAAATVAAYQHGTKLVPYKCQHCDLWHLKSVY